MDFVSVFSAMSGLLALRADYRSISAFNPSDVWLNMAVKLYGSSFQMHVSASAARPLASGVERVTAAPYV